MTFKNLSRILVINLCIILIANNMLCYAHSESETDDLANIFYLHVQMMKKSDNVEENEQYTYEKDGKDTFIEAIQKDECILVDYEKLCTILKIRDYGGDYSMLDIWDNKSSLPVFFTARFNKLYEDTFSIDLEKDNSKNSFSVQKNIDSSLIFYMRKNSDIAFAYTPKTGPIITHLGADVAEVNGTLMVPLVMFLNLIDASSNFTYDENTLCLFPGTLTVMDILTSTTLTDYNFDIVEDTSLNNPNFIQATKYIEYYSRFKDLFQGVTTLNFNQIVKSLPDNTSTYSDTLFQQLSQSSIDEQKAIQNITLEQNLDINMLMALNAWCDNSFNEKFKKGKNASYGQCLEDWETAEEQFRKTTFTSRNSLIENNIRFTKFKSNDKRETKKDLEKFYAKTKGIKIASMTIPIAISATKTYFSLANAIENSNQIYNNALNTYINFYYDRYKKTGSVGDKSKSYLDYRYDSGESDYRIEYAKRNFILCMPKNMIDEISDNLKLYTNQGRKNIFDNEELSEGVISDVVNSVLGVGAGIALDKAAKSTIMSKVITENLLGGWELATVSVGWDILEVLANAPSGAFDAMYALHDSIYAMLLENDSELINSCYGSLDDMDAYRQLTWVMLKSYYLTRMDAVAFYYPKNSEQYKTNMPTLADDCNELLEMMSVLMYGIEGITQESLDEAYQYCLEYNKELLDSKAIIVNSNIDSIKQAEAYLNLVEQEIAKNGKFTIKKDIYNNYDYNIYGTVVVKLIDFNNDGIDELLIANRLDDENEENLISGKFTVWTWKDEKIIEVLNSEKCTSYQDGGDYLTFIDTGEKILPYVNDTIDFTFWEFDGDKFVDILNGDAATNKLEEMYRLGTDLECGFVWIDSETANLLKEEMDLTIQCLKDVIETKKENFSEVEWIPNGKNINKELYKSFSKETISDFSGSNYINSMKNYYIDVQQENEIPQFFLCDLDFDGEKELCLTTVCWGYLKIYDEENGEIYKYDPEKSIGHGSVYYMTSKGLYCAGGYGTGASGYSIFSLKDSQLSIVEEGESSGISKYEKSENELIPIEYTPDDCENLLMKQLQTSGESSSIYSSNNITDEVNADLYQIPERDLAYYVSSPLTGDDVKYVQAALIEMNYNNLVLTGVFDFETEMAVRRFQLNHNLYQDGIVEENTLAELKNALATWRQTH